MNLEQLDMFLIHLSEKDEFTPTQFEMNIDQLLNPEPNQDPNPSTNTDPSLNPGPSTNRVLLDLKLARHHGDEFALLDLEDTTGTHLVNHKTNEPRQLENFPRRVVTTNGTVAYHYGINLGTVGPVQWEMVGRNRVQGIWLDLQFSNAEIKNYGFTSTQNMNGQTFVVLRRPQYPPGPSD
jgi:hypothetical protein